MAMHFVIIGSMIDSKTKISYAKILRSTIKAKHSLKSIQVNLQCFLPLSAHFKNKYKTTLNKKCFVAMQLRFQSKVMEALETSCQQSYHLR